jgi:anhydro-N-acetylmuramic acid kinase
MSEFYIGLMSGTSADGIDAALVDFAQTPPSIIATHYQAYPQTLRDQIHAISQPGVNEIQRLGELDILLGKAFADAVNQLLKKQSLSAGAIKAIGSHGQTIRHSPNHTSRFTLQIGDPNTITAETGITTVADFRRKDIALGGQGAPLVPAFHQFILASSTVDRAVVNIGGIANVTLLQPNTEHVIGFDTGPGNTLLDAWISHHQQKTHDTNGDWGKQGKIQTDLLNTLLSDMYFKLPPPKSTGREYFHLNWLRNHLESIKRPITAEDVQATLTELTAQSILQAIQQQMPRGEILICGGGARNQYLMERIQTLAQTSFSVNTTQKYGIDPDWVEAVAFAWLAKQTLNHQPGNLPSVTGAKQAAVLGGVYYY